MRGKQPPPSEAPTKNALLKGVPIVKASAGYPGLRPPNRNDFPSADAHLEAIRRHLAAIAAFNRQKSEQIGIKEYRWLAVDVHGCCSDR